MRTGLKNTVEPEGFEPSSKHGIDRLSTCLFLNLIFEKHFGQGQPEHFLISG